MDGQLPWCPSMDLQAWLFQRLTEERVLIVSQINHEIAKILDDRHIAILQEVEKHKLQQALVSRSDPNEEISNGNVLASGPMAILAQSKSFLIDNEWKAETKISGKDEEPPGTSSTSRPSPIEVVELTKVLPCGSVDDDRKHLQANIPEVCRSSPSQSSQTSSGKKQKYLSKSLSHMSLVDETELSFVEKLVGKPEFEYVASILTLLNTILMAVEGQYVGLESGYIVGASDYYRPAAEMWPAAQTVFAASNIFFVVVFAIEFMLRIVAMKFAAIKSGWIWFDFIMVASGLLKSRPVGGVGINLLMFRTMCLMRAVHKATTMKGVKSFHGLFLLIRSIKASAGSLFWSFLVLIFAQLATGLLISQTLQNYIRDTSKPRDQRVEVFNYWGTSTLTMLTMSEITLANWIVSCRVLVKNVGETYALFYLGYRCLFCFAVLRVITAVFIAETQRVVASDDAMAILKREQHQEGMMQKLRDIFSEIDESGDGVVTKEEFNQLLSDPILLNWLSTLDLEVTDLETMFSLLDDGDGSIAVDEFINGIGRIRGQAKSIDVVNLLTLSKRMESKMEASQLETQNMLARLMAPSREGTTSASKESVVMYSM